jgi:Flp pilus assembly protein TadG
MRPRRSSDRHRRGSTLVETAVVLPVVLMLTVGTCIIGLGIYRYELVATLAREGARYASVHGTEYAAAKTGNVAATPATIYQNAILPLAAGIDTAYLTYSVTWNTTNSPTSGSPPVYNTVSVTVTYQWTPELYISGPINLTSTSVMTMSY